MNNNIFKLIIEYFGEKLCAILYYFNRFHGVGHFNFLKHESIDVLFKKPVCSLLFLDVIWIYIG